MHCLVVPVTRSPGIGNGLSYAPGPHALEPGMLVRIPLRKKEVDGIVLSAEETSVGTFALKPVTAVTLNHALLPPAQLHTLRWMADYYHCSVRGALTPFLPAPPWRSLAPKPLVGYRKGKSLERGGKKQVLVTDELAAGEWVEASALRERTGASAATLRSLEEGGYIVKEEIYPDDAPRSGIKMLKGDGPVLSGLQQQAYDAIAADHRPSLLFGITGSGKTEVYASLIRDAAKAGKQSILLLPEILLTEQTIHRFIGLFSKDRIEVIHSRLTPAARRKAWMRIRRGEITLVIGSRSALFAPCAHLGLVLIDEEHEWTYKNEQTPRYHARETAETLCRFAGAKLVLGSATPSVEAWHRAKTGRYHLVELPQRYKNHPLPTVRVVDLANVKFGSLYPFSPPLLEAIEQRLQKNEQSVLFLNRRGVATAMLCLQCRRRIVSPETQLPFTVHRTHAGRPYLLDHFSGVSAPVPAACPHCASVQLMAVGAGTQRIEETLSARYPHARLLRADADTLRHPEQMRDLLATMREGRADILLGTQSVVKGLDLPGVTLAAVLLADVGLSLPHFRAGERVFQLLTQLTGRSGRAKPGEVIIQTFRPGAPEVVAAAQHRTAAYLDAELQLREKLGYPPSTEMARFLCTSDQAEQDARLIQKTVIAMARKRQADVRVNASPTLFGGGKVWHVLLRGTDVHAITQDLPTLPGVMDMDPMDCI